MLLHPEPNAPASTHDTIVDFAAIVGDFTWNYYVDGCFEGDHRSNDIEARLASVLNDVADDQGDPIRVIYTTTAELSGLRHAQVLLGSVSKISIEEVSGIFRQYDFDGVYAERWDLKRTSGYFQPYIPDHDGPDNRWHFELVLPRTAGAKPDVATTRFFRRPARFPS